MRSTILILILLFFLLFVPAVFAEDAVEWYTKAQSAMTVGDYSLAITDYNKALQLDRNYASAFAGRAVALNMQGKYTDAIASADSALAIKSMEPVALNARALALFSLGRYDEATTAYDKLFLVEQNRKEAYCNQAYAYLILNKTDNAIAGYDRCTQLDPLNIEVWNYRGLTLMQAQKYTDALSAFDHATYISIKNATVWNNKGEALVALGKPVDALQCFNKALGIDPGYTRAKLNKENATGKQQSFNITGNPTTKAPIRTGSATATIPPPGKTTAVGTLIPEGTPDTSLEVTDVPVPTKTTYTPVSPLTILGALCGAAGIAAVLRRK